MILLIIKLQGFTLFCIEFKSSVDPSCNVSQNPIIWAGRDVDTTPPNITHIPLHQTPPQHTSHLSPPRYTLCTSEFVFKIIPDSSISNPVFSIIILLTVFVSQSRPVYWNIFFRLIRLIINEVLICIFDVQFWCNIYDIDGEAGALTAMTKSVGASWPWLLSS